MKVTANQRYITTFALMKPGQIGRALTGAAAGHYVLKVGSPNVQCVVDLEDVRHFWTGGMEKNSLQVEILPPDSILTIVTEA